MENTKTVTQITRDQLVALLASVTHAQPIGFSALTDAMARKTGCPYVEIMKLSTVHPMTGADYASAVNRQREREGSAPDFAAQDARYDRLSPALVRYRTTGNLCLPVLFSSQVKQARKPVYLVRKAIGAPLTVVSKETVEPWLEKPRAQPQQGLAKELNWRTFGVKTLIRVSLGGRVYKIRQG